MKTLLTLLVFTLSLTGSAMAKSTQQAIFAGGCFWCTEAAFDDLKGVIETLSGYTGGTTKNPTYQEIGSGNTGHFEALQVTYDPTKISYQQLLTAFWHSIDPTDFNGQFADKGSQYHTAIFYSNDDQKTAAEKSKSQLAQEHTITVATKILPASPFYPAEEYHQDYHQKNPTNYVRYKFNSGRTKKLKEIWGENTPSKD